MVVVLAWLELRKGSGVRWKNMRIGEVARGFF
jgi:hypothetical protein